MEQALPTSDDLLRLFDREKIAYERFDHRPVYTCEEAREVLPDTPGRATKNLFLRDEKGKRHILLVVSDEKQVDLKQLSKTLGVRPLSLASADRLKSHLGLDPGSVTILGVFGDREHRVELVIDRDLENCDAIQCHPLVNTSTLVIAWPDVLRILELTGHTPMFTEIPVRAAA